MYNVHYTCCAYTKLAYSTTLAFLNNHHHQPNNYANTDPFSENNTTLSIKFCS